MIRSYFPMAISVNSKSPFLSDTVPLEVLLINTLLPAMGCRLTASITRPFIVRCENTASELNSIEIKNAGILIMPAIYKGVSVKIILLLLFKPKHALIELLQNLHLVACINQE